MLPPCPARIDTAHAVLSNRQSPGRTANKMQGKTTSGQPDGNATPATSAGKPALPTIERYSTHYVRYNGSVGLKGANQSTHTAEVKFPTGAKLAVVKAFPLADKGWVNEALAWALGEALDVGVPP